MEREKVKSKGDKIVFKDKDRKTSLLIIRQILVGETGHKTYYAIS